jgi:hypothetical protein
MPSIVSNKPAGEWGCRPDRLFFLNGLHREAVADGFDLTFGQVKFSDVFEQFARSGARTI